MRYARLSLLAAAAALLATELPPQDPRAGPPRQGLRGRLQDHSGKAVVGARIYLMPQLAGNHLLLQQLQLKRLAKSGSISGQALRHLPKIDESALLPAATGRSNGQGHFEIGVEKSKATKPLDAWIIHDRYCDKSLTALRIAEERWNDIGKVELWPAAIIFGSITKKESGLPVANARVQLVSGPPALVLAGSVLPPPGREDGITATTGPSGNYRLPSIDSDRSFELHVAARGFVRVSKRDLEVETTGTKRVDFALVRGNSIAGRVMGSGGQPVAKARIRAYSLQIRGGSGPAAEGETDEKGYFKISGLDERDKQIRLSARARGFAMGQTSAQAGTQNLEIRLKEHGKIKVVATGDAGQPLTDYKVSLQRHSLAGKVPYLSAGDERDVRGAVDGSYLFDCLRPGIYALRVSAPGHALAYSNPFVVAESGTKPGQLKVKLGKGGTLEGIVLDGARRPLSGVLVKTTPPGFTQNPLARMFPTVSHLTTREARTDAKGRYSLDLLTEGDYQLLFTHPSFCDHVLAGKTVTTGQTTALEPTVMGRGAAVSGLALDQGKPLANAKVSITRARQVTPFAFLQTEAVSDDKGRFTFTKRLPPGNYLARIVRASGINPLQMLANLGKNQTSFTIKAGQKKARIKLELAR